MKAEKFDETKSNTFQDQSLPAKKIREAKSLITIKDGEIIVLGGLQEGSGRFHKIKIQPTQ